MEHTQEVLDKLAAKEFEALIGTAECVWLDAKESPYVLDTTKQKLELAKDVSALANAAGGIIVLGFDTGRDPITAGERISKVCVFPLAIVDPDRYRKIVHEYVYPPLDISVRLFEAADGRGVAAIVVDSASTKPCIVSKMMDETGQSIGAHFGFFERKRDVIPPVSVARIQQQLSAGQQWTSIEERLLAIETIMAGWGKAGPPATSSGITDHERDQRLEMARIALERDDAPIVYYAANALGECDFPTLFHSHAERVVRLIENPPKLRREGFSIWAANHSEIVGGKLRRTMIEGVRLIELWKDGLFSFMAPGDEDFLGWRMQGSDKPIRINNFVLAESLLQFCWLTKLIFEESNPNPVALRLVVGMKNLSRRAGAAILSAAPEEPRVFHGDAHIASAANLEVSELADWAQYDAEDLAALLMAKIYNWFGFEAKNAPYIDWSGPKPRLLATTISGHTLPGEVETPGY